MVRAPAGLVYRTVTDLAGWSTWWPGITIGPAAGAEHWRLTAGRRPRRLRFDAHASDWRHDVGFRVTFAGDLAGVAEWWLEPVRGGTVVHHLLGVERADGGDAARRAERLRRVVRRGLWGLQDRCEAAVLLALAGSGASVRTPHGVGGDAR